MMNYICEHCGAYLDPGEKCDCMDEKKQMIEKIMGFLIPSDDGQFCLNIGGNNGIKTL